MAFWDCPNIEMAEAVAEGSESHGWYHYFEGANVAGGVQTLEDWVKHVLRMNGGPKAPPKRNRPR